MKPVDIPDFSVLGPYGACVGQTPERPIKVLAHLTAGRIEAFVVQVLFAMAVRRSFDHGRLFVVHDRAAPFKSEIVGMADIVTYAWHVPANVTMPLDFLDPSSDAVFRSPNSTWLSLGATRADIVLVESMMDWRRLGWFPSVPRFTWANDAVAAVRTAMFALGVDPKWWYVAAAVPEGLNDTDAGMLHAAFARVADILSREFGAQLLLVGDPSAPFGALPDNVIDARTLPRGQVGQAFAVARARFLLDILPSAWLWFAASFGTPWLRRVPAHDIPPLPGRGFVLPVRDDGEVANALEAGTRRMIARTAESPFWRLTEPERAAIPANTLQLPVPFGPPARSILDP